MATTQAASEPKGTSKPTAAAAQDQVTTEPNGTSKPVNGTSKPVNEADSPTDSVILDSRRDSLNFGLVSHGDVPKSDALRQPVAALGSRLNRSLGSWSVDGSLSQDIGQLLDFVAVHRLKRMPHRGSKWDKFLQHCVAFAGQVHHYEEAVAETLLESSLAASVIYGCVHALIEVCLLQED